jgi:hypothetical protein
VADHDDDALYAPRAAFAIPLGKHWRVEYVLEVHDGAAVVAELHITPIRLQRRPKPGVEDLSPADAWEADPDYIPARGLTARDLRRVSLGPEITAQAFQPSRRRRLFSHETGEAFYHEDPPLFSEEVTGARKNARGYGRSDRFYAEVAAMYVAAVQSGSGRPIHDVHEQLTAAGQHFALETVRVFRQTAVERGLLTRPPRAGFPGGRLPERAEELLRDPSGPPGVDGPPST